MARRKRTARQTQTGYGKGITKLPGVKAPKAPSKPAYGTYDPALDQQERAANRGLGDLVNDVTTANSRSTQDLGIGQANIERQAGRSLADLLTARTRGVQDYTTDKGERTRQYGILGGQQSEKAAAANVLGGALAQAAAKRAANQGREQGVADTNYHRFLQDSTSAEYRLGVDKNASLADLQLGYDRGFQDRNDPEIGQLPRAQRENAFLGQDINELRVDQAKQAGLLPAFTPYTPRPVTQSRPGRRSGKRKGTGYGRGARGLF